MAAASPFVPSSNVAVHASLWVLIATELWIPVVSSKSQECMHSWLEWSSPRSPSPSRISIALSVGGSFFEEQLRCGGVLFDGKKFENFYEINVMVS